MESSVESFSFKWRLENHLEETRREIKLFQDVPQPMEPTRGDFLNLARDKETLLKTLLNWKESLEKVFPIGTLVTIKGLKNKPELNLKKGVIRQFNVSTERCLVKMEQGLGVFKFKPVNLFGLSPKWENQYQQVIEYLQQYNLQIISYLQVRDKIVEKYHIPAIPPISEKENLHGKCKVIQKQLEELKDLNIHDNNFKLNQQFLVNLEKHNRACYYLMHMNEKIKRNHNLKSNSSLECIDSEIIKQIEDLELSTLMVSYPSYNRCVTLINMKVIHQLLKEEDKEGQELSPITIQEIPKIVVEARPDLEPHQQKAEARCSIRKGLLAESRVAFDDLLDDGGSVGAEHVYNGAICGHDGDLSKGVSSGNSISSTRLPTLHRASMKEMTPSLVQKNLGTKTCSDQVSLTCIQQCILSWYIRLKFRHLRKEMGYHIKKAMSEIKSLKIHITLVSEQPIVDGLIEFYKKKHSLLITFLKKILGEDTSESKLSSLNDDDLFLELIEFRKKFLEEFNFPVIGMNQPNKYLSLKIQETKDKLVSLNRDDSNNPRILLEIAIMEKKLFYYQEKKKLNIKKQILSQQNVQKWANVNEDNLSYQQTVVRAFDCLEIEDLRISNEAFQINLAQTYIQNKESLLHLIIQENTNSLLVEQEKIPSKKSRKKKTKNNKEKKRKNKETSFIINTHTEDVNSIKIDFTKYKKIAFTRWTQYFNLVKAIITIQSLFRKNIWQYQYQKIRLKIIGFQSRVRKRLHWLKIKQPQSCPSEKTKYLNAKQRRQFRRQQRRVLSLEAEVDDFFQFRYQEELKKLLSGQMDTTPNLGLRVPYEIQSRKCDGIPKDFIPQNNF